MGIHNLNHKPAERLSKKTISGVWNNIAGVIQELQRAGISFDDIFKKQFGDGDDTLFWMDTWCGGEPFRDRFPELYQLERRKSCIIKERLHEPGHMWDWRSPLTTDEQIHSFRRLSTAIGAFCLTLGKDIWRCALTCDGEYHVGALRSKLDNMELANNEEIIPWIHDIPIKVSAFVWRANLGRIASNNALNRRGVPGIEDRYVRCLQ